MRVGAFSGAVRTARLCEERSAPIQVLAAFVLALAFALGSGTAGAAGAAGGAGLAFALAPGGA
eukprot:8871979-Heterocapsa_arctica.AAC.1